MTLVQRISDVAIQGELNGAPPGWHEFMHTRSASARTGSSPQAGIWVHGDGTAQFEVVTDRFALTEIPRVASAAAGSSGGTAAGASPIPTLFDDDGAALVIHAQPDDHVSEPSGSAGDRLAWGEIVRR